MKRLVLQVLSTLFLCAASLHAEESISLTKMPCEKATTGWGNIGQNRSVDKKPLTIAGKTYKIGLGVHANSTLIYQIPEGASRFTVIAGVDDETNDNGSVKMTIYVQKEFSKPEKLVSTDIMTGKSDGQKLDIKLPKWAEVIILEVSDGGNGIGLDHADWCEPTFWGPKKMIAPEIPNWEKPEIVEVNKMKPHAYFKTYPKTDVKVLDKTPWEKSLNGTWKFMWSDKTKHRPKDFYKPSYDISKWYDIKVPISWQSAGFGVPIYKNNVFPFNSKPPLIDQSFNPVGSYKRTFTVPKDWNGKQVIIHFAGVDSALSLWVNGKYIGYSEGSRTPAEFDITKELKPGKNDIAVEVIRFSTGAWLEDQDMFRLSGIFRDVYLVARPQGEKIWDFYIKTPLDKNYKNATFLLDVTMKNSDKGSIEIEVTDKSGKKLFSDKAPIGSNGVVQFKKNVTAPKLWSAEEPNLYSLKIKHFDNAGELIEVVPWHFGFRWVEIKDNRLLVNGKPIIIAGANRHEHSPENGHYVPYKELLRDILMMKKMNFNAIRTCHYPNDPMLYFLCDKYGLYVTDEANIESHGYQKMPNTPIFDKSHHKRVHRMLERDKNFVCVTTWSLGNESGKGGAHNDNYTWIKKHDYRPVGYQRHGQNDFTDYNGAFYVGPGGLNGYTKNKKKKPMIQTEYAHAMGNSSGNMKEYWDIHWADNNVQGAFVWDWIDQGMKWPVPERSWVKIPGIDTDWLLIEGKQISSKGLQGILYFPHKTDPTLKAPWTLSLKLRTSQKTSDSFGFYHLFSKDSSVGSVFLECNNLVFQTFGKDRNKIVVPLADSFFDGEVHNITVIQGGKEVSFYVDDKLKTKAHLQYSLKKKWDGYLSFGPGVNTPLVRKNAEKDAPTLLEAKLMKGVIAPSNIASSKALLEIDFTKPVKVIQKKPANGSFYAYGGYFENRRGYANPGNFCMNGVMASDGTPHPGIYAFKYTQSPFAFEAEDKETGKFKLHNRHFFKGFDSNYMIDWQLTENGTVIKKGSLKDLNCAPQKTVNFSLPFANFAKKKGCEYRVNFTVKLAKNTNWAKVGHIIGWEQFQVANLPNDSKFGGPALKKIEKGNLITLSGSNFSVTFDKKLGTMVSYKQKGKELLAGPVTPDIWRAITDNDKAAISNYRERWRSVNGFKNVKLTYSEKSQNHHHIEFKGMFDTVDAETEFIFDIYGDGHIAVELKMLSVPPVKSNPKKWDNLLRFGLRFPVVNTLTNLKWYGVGPHESYCDRNYELIGLYSNTVDGMFTDYPRPQENGNICDVRSASLTDASGHGIAVTASPENPVNISARRHLHKTMEAVKYSYQLPISNKVYFNVDYKLNGAAGINTWGASPLSEYKIPAKAPISYKFILFAK